jgi:membrane-bound serine protease (ClpP class)
MLAMMAPGTGEQCRPLRGPRQCRGRKRRGQRSRFRAAERNGQVSRRRRIAVSALAALLLVTAVSTGQDPAAPAPARPAAYVFPVPLPLTGDADLQISGQLEKKINELPAGGERPIFILEFAAPESGGGEGSQFERALSLARYLASDRLSRVRTVAYVPRSVKGHAVLPVMACEEIAIAENAEFGSAGAGENFVDPAMRESYQRIADLRRTIPAAVAAGMVDRELEVARVELLDGSVRYVLGEELAKLQQGGTVSKVETLAAPGDLVQLTGRQMRLQYGFAAHMVNDRKTLADELKVAPESLVESQADADQWNLVRVNLFGRLTSDQATRTIRMIQDRLRRGGGCLFVICIDSPGGTPSDGVRLASFLAGLDKSTARTCAFVDGDARAAAALVALACDDLVMTDEALIGGPGDYFIGERELEDLRGPVKQLAKTKDRDWSLMLSLIDPELQVFRHTRAGTGEVRYFGSEERSAQSDPAEWTVGDPIATAEGLTAATAKQLGLLRFSAEQFEEIQRQYGVQEPAELLESGWLISRIEHLASQAWFSRTLLFIAFFALISEASTPGLGIPGFISAVCFLLFFWAQFLNGTAGWLEVLLFLGGLACVLMEVLVIPGMGIFGIGGAVMVIASIVLASQTFVVPHNSYQMAQMPKSMFSAVIAGFGGVAAIYVFRRFLPHTPFLKNLMLTPPDEEVDTELARREQVVDLAHLLHKTGVAMTPLVPSGKARFGDDTVDVLTNGEFIAPGGQVVVLEVRGHRILVQSLRS